MPDKDINIHVRAQDTEETKRQVDGVSESVEGFGRTTTDATRKASEGTEKSVRSFFSMGDILERITTQAISFGAALLGIEGAKKILDAITQYFERMATAMRDIYDKALELRQIGQNLEFQTNTAGQQRQWGMKAIEVQKVGGLPDTIIAGQLMSAVETTYKQQGGLKNTHIFDFTKQLAPLIGAAGLNQGGIDSLLRIAEQAKIPPDINAFKTFFAKTMAGAAGGKMTLEQFLENTGSGTGFTNYLQAGGTLDKAIGLYSAAGNASANKRTGNALLDLLVQISAGENKKAESAVERFSGKQLAAMSMDERADTVLNYINSLSEATRVKTLTNHGFPSAADLAKLATPQARQIIESTQKAIAATTPQDLDKQIKAYEQSPLAKQRAEDAQAAGEKLQEATDIEAWQRRLNRAKEHRIIERTKGEGRFFVGEGSEPYYIALKNMETELEAITKQYPVTTDIGQRAEQSLQAVRGGMFQLWNTGPFTPLFMPGLNRRGVALSQTLEELKSQSEPNEPNSVNITNNYGDTYHPAVGAADVNRFNPNVR